MRHPPTLTFAIHNDMTEMTADVYIDINRKLVLEPGIAQRLPRPNSPPTKFQRYSSKLDKSTYAR